MPGHVAPTDSPIGDVEIAPPTASGPVSPPTTLVDQMSSNAAPPQPIEVPQGRDEASWGGPVIARTPVWPQRQYQQYQPAAQPPNLFEGTSESREDIPGYSNSEDSEDEGSRVDHTQGLFIGQGIKRAPAINPQDPSLRAPLILPSARTGRNEGPSNFFLAEVDRKLSGNTPPLATQAQNWAENLPSQVGSAEQELHGPGELADAGGLDGASSPPADNSPVLGTSSDPGSSAKRVTQQYMEMDTELRQVQTLDDSDNADRPPMLKVGTSNFGEPLGSLGKLSPHGKGKAKGPDGRELW